MTVSVCTKECNMSLLREVADLLCPRGRPGSSGAKRAPRTMSGVDPRLREIIVFPKGWKDRVTYPP